MSATRSAVVTVRRADLFGETRDERIKEFHEMNDTPVIGLWEVRSFAAIEKNAVPQLRNGLVNTT